MLPRNFEASAALTAAESRSRIPDETPKPPGSHACFAAAQSTPLRSYAIKAIYALRQAKDAAQRGRRGLRLSATARR
jgi:hypothetical protein